VIEERTRRARKYDARPTKKSGSICKVSASAQPWRPSRPARTPQQRRPARTFVVPGRRMMATKIAENHDRNGKRAPAPCMENGSEWSTPSSAQKGGWLPIRGARCRTSASRRAIQGAAAARPRSGKVAVQHAGRRSFAAEHPASREFHQAASSSATAKRTRQSTPPVRRRRGDQL